LQNCNHSFPIRSFCFWT